jgi:hypothetical protein
MKIRRLLASSLLLLLLILLVTAILTSPPRPAQAQAVGYVKTGQQAVTATAAQVTGISYGTVCIKGLKANSISVYLGGAGVTTSTGMELAPGDIPYCATVNAGQFYVIASTTGASVSWILTR